MSHVVMYHGQEIKVPAGINEDDLWEVNVKGGYDPLGGRWRGKSGTYRRFLKGTFGQSPV